MPARKHSKRSKTLQTFQKAPQGQGHFSIRHPRANQGHSNGFLLAFKAAVCQPANTPNAPKPKRSKRHPRAKATSQSGTPGPRPQQRLSIGFQSCRLPARKHSKRSKTLQTFQKAPQGQRHSSIRHPKAKATAISFYWLSKLPFASPQTLQTPQNPPNVPKGTPPKPSNPPNTVQNHPNPPKPSKPSKHLPQQAPQGQGHFSIRHPRAKATAMAFYWLSKLPFASPQTLQTLQNPPNVPTGTPGPRPLLNQAPQGQGHSKGPPNTVQNPPNPQKPSKPSKHHPQQAPQGQGHFSIRHPRAKATAIAKAAVCQPANSPNAPKPFKRSKSHPRAKATSQSGTPGPRPQQRLSTSQIASLGNLLQATMACTFSTSQLPNVVGPWWVLPSLTWKCPSCHNGMQFFISHLASWLRTRRFSDRTFRPSGPINHWKKTVGREVPPFSRTGIFLLLIFPILTLLPSDSSHLCFSTVHIVGSLTGKLPSTSHVGVFFQHKQFQPSGHGQPATYNFDTEYDMLTTPKPRSA